MLAQRALQPVPSQGCSGCSAVRSHSNALPWMRPLQQQHAAMHQRRARSARRRRSGAEREQATAAPPATTSDGAASKPPKAVSCVAAGMEVQCVLETVEEDGDEGGVVVGSSSNGNGATNGTAAANTASSSTSAAAEQSPLKRAIATALLVSPFFFWGTSMVAMKGVTAHTTPLFLGSLRLLPAGAALVAWAAADGRKQPAGAAAWAWVAAFAAVDGAAFQGFLAEGLQRTSAGLGSVIIDSQPLSVALLAALFFGEALTPAAVVGLVVGVAGLLLLELPEDVVAAGLADGPRAAADALAAIAASNTQASGSGATGGLLDSGEFWMLLAAQSMAVGTVMVRWVTKHCDPVMATGWHMVLGGAALLGASLALEGGDLPARLAGFTAADGAAMAYVALLGGAASYGIFFYNATRGSLTALSSLTFLTPMFAAAGGYALLGETLTPLQLAGAGVTLGAVLLINAPKGDDGGGGGEAAS